jgi:glucosamine--fructose-6-phosphate aminotransferase (isomerizing)
MHFGRYTAGYLPQEHPGQTLVLAISVSGQVTRTTEALDLARQKGALAVAVTGNPAGPLAQAATAVVECSLPPANIEPTIVVPGLRSYVGSLLALYFCAIRLGEARGHLSRQAASELRRELANIGGAMARTAQLCDAESGRLVKEWSDASHFVFCGAGPHWGTALFAAAKIIEASGDPAVAQELEEWAHIEYFGREAGTPTIIISGGWDHDRTLEIATAAKAVGRRVAIIAPESGEVATRADRDALLPLGGAARDCFSPLLACLPAALLAARRAALLGEAYFRAFGGGRSIEGGGGISRIRDSHRIDKPFW